MGTKPCPSPHADKVKTDAKTDPAAAGPAGGSGLHPDRDVSSSFRQGQCLPNRSEDYFAFFYSCVTAATLCVPGWTDDARWTNDALVHIPDSGLSASLPCCRVCPQSPSGLGHGDPPSLQFLASLRLALHGRLVCMQVPPGRPIGSTTSGHVEPSPALLGQQGHPRDTAGRLPRTPALLLVGRHPSTPPPLADGKDLCTLGAATLLLLCKT